MTNQMRAYVSEVVFQIVPPTILGALASNAIASRTDLSMFQSGGLVIAGLLICIMINSVRV